MNKFKILISVATKTEILPFVRKFDENFDSNNNFSIKFKNVFIDIHITGIGPVFTAFNLTEILNKNKYDLAINTGICGSFNSEIKLTQAVNVVSDEFADLGISSKNNFQTLFETGFLAENLFPFENGKLFADKYFSDKINIQKVSGITVSNVSGVKNQINFRKNKFNADIESMEGAAFFYICKNKNTKCIQIRTVSNYVEERNIKNWKLKESILNLSETLYQIIISINSKLEK
jgi:futalosine hydrolase